MENTKETPAAEVDPRYPNTPIGIVRSRDAFLRALPELLANPKYDRWLVAYCGAEQIGIAESEIDLIKECKQRGLSRDQYYIGCITPHAEDDEEIERGFYEFDEIADESRDPASDGSKPTP